MKILESLHRVVPPPAYLQMPCLGVDISDTSVKYINCTPRYQNGAAFSVTKWGEIDIEAGGVRRGVVEDVHKLATVLKEVRLQTGLDMVRVSLPEERAYLFETKIKNNISEQEIRSLLEFRLEENVPLSPKDAFFDYELIPGTTSDGEQRALVTAYARDTVQSYYEACNQAGLTAVAFEVEAQAIARATIPNTDPGTYMIVDFGKTRTGVGIVRQGVLMFTSTIDIGGSDISKSMRSILGDVPEAELTKIKNQEGLVTAASHPELTATMQRSIDAIVNELRLRIDYWNMRDVSEAERFIEGVILCGGSSNMKGIQRYMSDQLGITTYRANVWENVLSLNLDMPPISQRYAYGYATAIGLALGQHL